MGLRIFSPEVTVNDEAVFIKGDSFTFIRGLGETIVSPYINGTNIDNIHSKNQETQKGKMMFTLPSTPENAALVNKWGTLIDDSVIRVGDPNSNFTLTMTGASLINDPEINLGPEGELEVEFEGNAIG